MSERNVIQAAFDRFARGAGCSKKSGSWYLRSSETIVVLNLQKSQYGPQYYVNVALWLRSLGDDEAPKENKCHVRTRLTRLVPPEAEAQLASLLDLTSGVDEGQRGEALETFLRVHLLLYLKACSSLEGLRSGVGEHLVSKSLVTGPAQWLLAAS